MQVQAALPCPGPMFRGRASVRDHVAQVVLMNFRDAEAAAPAASLLGGWVGGGVGGCSESNCLGSSPVPRPR